MSDFALKYPLVEAIVARSGPLNIEETFRLRRDLWRKGVRALKALQPAHNP